jgi:hypothetical protein
MSKSVTDILNGGAEVFEEKNDDYGDSWRLVGEFLWLLTDEEGVELTSKDDFISFGLYTRRLDKLARGFNGDLLADDLNFEAVQDSHEDESVYAAMHAALASEQEKRDDGGEIMVPTGETNGRPPAGINHPTVDVDD